MGIKKNDGGDESNYDILLKTLVNVSMYPQYNNNEKICDLCQSYSLLWLPTYLFPFFTPYT
jgi:hypothetical protein